MHPKIAIVTPLKDEIDSIDRLIQSVESQSIPIFYWLIVENDSTDGSKEKLLGVDTVKNVENFEVKELEFEDKKYQLGTKYATIINHGFEILKSKKEFGELDYIGILDSDCFPESNYYQKLTSFMQLNPNIGISSGVIYDEHGNMDIANPNWVRGGCRLWNIKCFNQCGYLIAPSADTISATKAILNGWKIKPNKEIKVISRKLGAKTNFEYYGNSVYYRGHSLLYALLKTLLLFIKLEFKKGIQFFKGYFKSMFKKKERISDKQIRNYFKWYFLKK